MFWSIPHFAASSPVESILDKETFTLEELLDEEDVIQECKALNARLINFLRDRPQIAQLVRYIVEDAPEDAESRRIFKFPFVACEIITCEIDVILKSLVEDEELMDMLFSFLEPSRTHSPLLAGYFSKVVICLMVRKTTSLMTYVQNHGGILRQLVDLIGTTSIMEVLLRLVNADDHIYQNYMDVMQWVADSNLLEMIVDKLNPAMPPEVHANAAEVLCAIFRNAPSALAAKLTSPSFITRIFSHALQDPLCKSALVHALSVCILFLDPKRAATGAVLAHSVRSQHLYEPCFVVNPETINAMLPKLGHLLKILDISNDGNLLHTTYGELKPPLGKHRLKIVEFLAVMLASGDEAVENQLVSSGAIQQILDLFFNYPFNNALHHHVEGIILSCLECKNAVVVDHIFRHCDLIGRFLHADKNPILSRNASLVTAPAAPRQPPRAGYIGHITRISNKLVQVSQNNDQIRAYLKDGEWINWQTNVLSKRNSVENVYKWVCGRPTALQDRTRDSDEDEIHEKDYDVMAFSNNMSQAFRYCVYENDDADEVRGSRDQDDEDVYFDDDSAEVVISSLRLGDDNERCLFTNSNWFAFQDDRISEEPLSTSILDGLEDISLDETAGGNPKINVEKVVAGADGLADASTSQFESFTTDSVVNPTNINGFTTVQATALEASDPNLGPFQFDTGCSHDIFSDQLPEWVGWREPSDILVDGPDEGGSLPSDPVVTETNGNPTSTSEISGQRGTGEAGSSLFEDDAEFVGVEVEGAARLIDNQAMGNSGISREGDSSMIGGSLPKLSGVRKTCEDVTGIMEFSDMNHWRVEPEVGVVQE